MSFEQGPNLDQKKEKSQDELAKIGERVFTEISRIKEKVEELKKQKQDLLKDDSNSSKKFLSVENIEAIICQLEVKLITLEDLAGIE